MSEASEDVLKFVLIEQHKDVLLKSQTSLNKEKKKAAALSIIAKWEKISKTKLTDVSLLKKISNLKTRAKAALNCGKPINEWQIKILGIGEIVLDEFCNNLPKLRKEIVKSENENYSTDAWKKINEFLSFRYSSGVVNVAIKAKLVQTLSATAEKTIAESKTSPLIFESLLIVLQNQSMQNYYNSNAADFAQFLGTNIRYVTNLLQTNEGECEQFKPQIEKILTSMRTYIKQTPFLSTFKSAFAAEILPGLCELVNWTISREISIKKDFLAILQDLYFNGSLTKQLKQYFASTTVDRVQDSTLKEFHEIFEVPLNVFLPVVETVILSYRNDFEVLQRLLQFLLSDGGKLDIHTNTVETQLSGLTVFILLLKKYDVSLKFEIDSVKAHVYLGKRIESIVNDHYTSFPQQVLNILCATLRLDPLILEYSVCQIAVKFMLMAKSDEDVWGKYEEFIFLVIEMYLKLSRAEKFISQLMKNFNDTLSTTKLSKKLKRSLNNSISDGSTPSKKAKKSHGEDDSIVALENSEEYRSVCLLEKTIQKECELLSNYNPLQIRHRCNQLWNDIAFAFSPSISGTYTRFISGLVTKPSLVVWKSLIFTLKGHIQQMKEADGKCSENCIFLIEINSALLSQYFMGSRVAEQSDKSWDSIEQNRETTREILTEFGHAILSQEHNSRTMNAFLKLCHSASNFDLICWYYRPDSMQSSDDDENSKKLNLKKCWKKMFAYLSEKEWTTIEQRITNFGKRECKANINKIYLQRLKAAQLLEQKSETDVAKFVLSSAFDDAEQIADILNDETLSNWFIENLNFKQKRAICELLLPSAEGIVTLANQRKINNLDFIEILTFSSYKKIIDILTADKMESFSTIDFEVMFNGKTDDVCKSLNSILEKECTAKGFTSDKKHIKKHHDEISSLFDLLKSLPIGFCTSNSKCMLSLLNIIVYHYLNHAKETELSIAALNTLKVLLHFGEAPDIFRFMNLSTFITLVKSEVDVNSILGMVFERTRKCSETNTKLLVELFELLKNFGDAEKFEQRVLLEIAVLIVGDLSKDKTKRDQFNQFRDILYKIIENVANEQSNEWFLEATLPAFVILAKTFVNAHKSNAATNETPNIEQINKLIKLYLNVSTDCAEQHSVRLLNTALEHKIHLNLDGDELNDIVQKFWLNFKDSCNRHHDEASKRTMNSALKLIFDHKSTDEWIQLLTEVEKDIESSVFTEMSKQQSKMLALMAKCQLNSIKGRIFVGFFKNVTRQINSMIRAKSTRVADNFQWISDLLDCYTILVNNVQIPVSIELVDDILSFMCEINIKKIDAETFDSKHFAQLLEQMCALCLGLIQHRATFVIDRVPQFVNVFKDLLQTICWYKSNRNQHTQLEQAEVTMLAEVVHTLEKTNKYFVKYSKEVKRVAPYTLLFAIDLMITNERPTTLYSKIKTHVEYICYDLISICDYRVEGFILRNCNEASKAVYENLHRQYEKYFKFKGKV